MMKVFVDVDDVVLIGSLSALRDEHFHLFKYHVGSQLVSLYDIEHRVLRAQASDLVFDRSRVGNFNL
jgi:hypothetical protein